MKYLTKAEWDTEVNQSLSILQSLVNDDDYIITYNSYSLKEVNLQRQTLVVREDWYGDYYDKTYFFSYPSLVVRDRDLENIMEKLSVFKLQSHKKLFTAKAVRKNKIRKLL